MPTAGVEYRYPLINVQAWGTQTIEPIAPAHCSAERDLCRRVPQRGCPEPDFRRFQPVQGRQVLWLGSLRGRRTCQRRRPIHRAVQSRRQCQFPVRTVLSAVWIELLCARGHTNTGLNSGLDTARSDSVARVSYQPNSLHIHVPLPFRRERFHPATHRAGGLREFGRWTTAVFGSYAAQFLIWVPDAARLSSAVRA